AFQVTADVPEIYMQEFWAMAKLHHNSIRFKMDTKKSVLDLEAFREMLHISPRILNQSFAELPSKEEILEFLRFLGHSHEIRHLTDVNVNKLYQPWRSFASVINKCLTGKSSGIDSFRFSQAQILWGFYHRRNIDYAYLIWEDFVYQVEHKNQKRSNEMYYPRFTKVIIDYFMTRKPSISRRNRINWHYVTDDVLFSTIKVVSRHQTTQQYGAILPIELTFEEIRNSKAYKEYYACATGEVAPKPKASAKKKKDEGTGSKLGVPDVPSDDLEEELSWNSFDDEDVGEQTKETKESEGDKSNESDDESDEGSDDDTDETVKAEEEEADELYRDVTINQGKGLQVTQNVEDSHVTLTPVNPDGPKESSSVSSFMTRDAPIPPKTIPSIILENLPTFNSAFRFDERLRESSVAAPTRPPRDLYGFLDTTEAEASITRRHPITLHDTERMMMTAVDLDAQPDRASIRAEIMALRDRGTLLEDAYIEVHADLLRSGDRNESLEAHNRSPVARIETIETRMTEMEDRFQDTKDHIVSHVMRTQALEARAQIDTMEDAGHDAAYVMTWETLKKKLTDNLYSAFLRTSLADETEKVNKYISGLPDNIHGNLMSARPKTLDEAIELANNLMDQKVRTYTER
nr:hypothetical protein [Tanacetum cinerariifolium]